MFHQTFRKLNEISYAGCTLSPRESETMQELECRWKHSPQMLSCSLGHSCLASLALAFLAVCDVRVKQSHVSPRQHSLFQQSVMSESKGLVSHLAVVSCHTSNSRAHSKIVENHTHTVSSQVTPAREFCQTHSARVYSRYYKFQKNFGQNIKKHFLNVDKFEANFEKLKKTLGQTYETIPIKIIKKLKKILTI